MQVPDEAAARLKSYVYVYIDPRDGAPFYIGKGKGGRLFAHLRLVANPEDPRESEKVRRFAELKAAGLEPRIDLLSYGLTDDAARLVEAASIDLIGLPHLTNLVRGDYGSAFGRISSHDALITLSAMPVVVREKAILITINRLYRSDMSPLEHYEATRGSWIIGPRRDKAELALAVYQGVVREVYRIQAWHPAGTAAYETREGMGDRASTRWEFEGTVADDVRQRYVDRSVGKGGQNPIRYVNV